jgi:ubiquinone/menaquinone biosynthesis C-methylase UbiE
VLHALSASLDTGAVENIAYYDTMASTADNLLVRRAETRNHHRKSEMIVDSLGLREGKNLDVLEIGVGLGAHGRDVIRLGHEYTGIDISAGLLSAARQRYPELKDSLLVAADGMCIPFRDGTFDCVFFVAALHHIPDPVQGVAECMRVLKTGGRFAILEPKRFYPTQMKQALLHPKTEISAWKMKSSAVRQWALQSGAAEARIDYCVFTPNGPAALVPIFNAMDRQFAGNALLKHLSVMFCVTGRK